MVECMKNLLNREPAVVAGLILTTLPTLFGFTAAFDIWSPSTAQMSAITSLYVALAGVVIYVLRGTVWSPETVQALNDSAGHELAERARLVQLVSDTVRLVETAPTDEDAAVARNKLDELLPPPTL